MAAKRGRPTGRVVDVEYTNVFERNARSGARILANIGGARSSKSHSIAQLLIMRAHQTKGKEFGIARKTFPALRMTAYRSFMDLLREYGLYCRENHNQSYHWYELHGNRFQFFSIDQPGRLKSTEFHYLWLEEADEFTYDDFVVLLTRMSGKVLDQMPNQMFLSLNPSNRNSWVRTRLPAWGKDVEEIASSYKDNPFLAAEYIKILEGLKDQDENYWRIYGLGEWGMLENLIWPDYDFFDQAPEGAETIWGLDFGFNNPTALLEVGLAGERHAYLTERLYQTGLTNQDLIARMEAIIPPHRRGEAVYADSAEPQRIEEIARAGFNVFPADKDVRKGIDTVKCFKRHVSRESVNLKKELDTYSWRVDRAGLIIDEPVKFRDHLACCARYALHTHMKDQVSMLPPVEEVYEESAEIADGL